MQCQNCGAINPENGPQCASCGKRLIAASELESPPVARCRFTELVDRELGPPPRAVPGVLKLAALRLDLAAITFAAVTVIGRGLLAAFAGPPAVQPAELPDGVIASGPALSPLLVSVIFGAAAALLFLISRRKALWLLRHGIASRAELVLSRSSGHLEASHLRYAKGWDVQVASYDGPSHRDQLRLWAEDGASATFRTGGLFGNSGYEGGIYLLDPHAPRRHLAIESYGVPLRPDGGRWRVWPQANKWVAIRIVVAVLVVAGTFWALMS